MSISEKNQYGEIQWLKCRIDKGMFSDEMAVTYPAEGEQQKSVFVEKSAVKGHPGQLGRVCVRVVNKGNYLIAILPTGTGDIVYINKGDVNDE